MPTTKVSAKTALAAKSRPEPQRSRLSRMFSRARANQKAANPRSGGNLGALIRDVRQELKKVEWPSREELVKLTAAVVALSAIVGIFLGGVDFIFQELFKFIISLSNGGV